MTKTVIVAVATKAQTFAEGTVDTLFTFSIKDTAGAVVSTVDTASLSASFPEVVPGTYSAEVTKNGVTVAQAFTIAPDVTTLQVPDTLTVTFS